MKRIIPNINVSVSYERPVYESLLYDVTKFGQEETITVHSDAFLLFNQKRLETLGADTSVSALKSLTSIKTSHSSDGLSDQQLLDTQISRHIQSPGEIKQYGNSINSITNKVVQTMEFKKEFDDNQRKSDEILQAYKQGLNEQSNG